MVLDRPNPTVAFFPALRCRRTASLFGGAVFYSSHRSSDRRPLPYGADELGAAFFDGTHRHLLVMVFGWRRDRRDGRYLELRVENRLKLQKPIKRTIPTRRISHEPACPSRVSSRNVPALVAAGGERRRAASSISSPRISATATPVKPTPAPSMNSSPGAKLTGCMRSSVESFHVATWIEGRADGRAHHQTAPRRHSPPLRLAGGRPDLSGNPASSVRGPKHIVRKGKTPVLEPAEARALLDSIDATTPSACAIAHSSASWSTASPASVPPSA